ncbi:transporter substrate-binding domain-containing protein [Shewanella sp. SR44-3]|uniref:substrate-binding periplasmic protein n=1 Tax=Shewanella sp. SR44-3 TaxID=2760936 RepID=UPI002873ED98|nr:transporter substrate-binding domain-containing protein [Shewanella sp. SR44-3]
MLSFRPLLVISWCIFSLLTATPLAAKAAMPDAEVILNYNVNASNSWYPYYIAQTPEAPGVLGEIIPKILALANIKSRKHNFPPKRTNQALEKGFLDFDVVSPSWFEEKQLADTFVASNPIMPIMENIVVLEKNQQRWQRLSQIKGRNIGTVRGYLYHDDNEFTRVDFKSERELILALHKGRIEAAISGDYPALYWAKELNLPISLAAVHSSGDLVIRLRKEHIALLPAINQAIQTLKDSGELQQIIDKYTLATP